MKCNRCVWDKGTQTFSKCSGCRYEFVSRLSESGFSGETEARGEYLEMRHEELAHMTRRGAVLRSPHICHVQARNPGAGGVKCSVSVEEGGMQCARTRPTCSSADTPGPCRCDTGTLGRVAECRLATLHCPGNFSVNPRLFHSEMFLGWLVCWKLEGIVGGERGLR